MLRDTYKAELEYLLQLCEELALREPSLAPLLGRASDASVERLLEGLAFSFARVHQRLRDDLPEIVEPIMESLCPEVLRPIASGTILGYALAPQILSPQVVPAGATFAGRTPGGETCLFRSDVACSVSPLSLTEVRVEPHERLSVTLVLKAFDGAALHRAVPKVLPLFFADSASALDARAFLLRHVRRIVARVQGAHEETTHATLRAGSTLGIPCTQHNVDLPSAEAFVALRDYFVFPERFAFAELHGLDGCLRASDGPEACSIEVRLELDTPVPKSFALDSTTLQLHAVPARNIFPVSKVVAKLSSDKKRCELRPQAFDRPVALYQIESVGLVSRNLSVTAVRPWADFLVPRSERERAEVRYEVRQTPSVVGPGVDGSVLFVGDGVDDVVADKVAAELEILATDGERAESIPLGGVCFATAVSPSTVKCTNLTPITRSAPPALGEGRLWRLFRIFKATLADLCDLGGLREVLAMANIPAQQHWPNAKTEEGPNAAVLRLSKVHAYTSSRRDVQSGAVVTVMVNPRAFAGKGDIRLFGEVLLPLFAAKVAESSWVELEIVDADGGVIERTPRIEGRTRGL